MKVYELINWAKENDQEELLFEINHLIRRGLLKETDDEYKLWMLMASGAYGFSGSKSKGKVCFCVQIEDHETEMGQENPWEGKELSGIVIDERKALETPCERVSGTDLVFSEGVVGALDREQRDRYCKSGIIEIESPRLRARYSMFKRAVEVCKGRTRDLKGAERVKAYIECMKEEL